MYSTNKLPEKVWQDRDFKADFQTVKLSIYLM